MRGGGGQINIGYCCVAANRGWVGSVAGPSSWTMSSIAIPHQEVVTHFSVNAIDPTSAQRRTREAVADHRRARRGDGYYEFAIEARGSKMQLCSVTDEQFIARIRRWERTRRIWGGVLLVAGLAMAVMSFWTVSMSIQTLEASTLDLPEEVHARQAEMTIAEVEERAALEKRAGFATGAVAGSFGGVTTVISEFAALSGLSLLFPDRKKPPSFGMLGPQPPPILIDDETVITGSMNFSKSGDERNHENVLIIHGRPQVIRRHHYPRFVD